jgi:Transposase
VWNIASVMRRAKNPQPVMKRYKPAIKINMDALAQDIAAYPGAFLYERAARPEISRSGIEHTLKHMGVTDKKTLMHPKTAPAARALFQEKLHSHKMAGKPVIYIDESGHATLLWLVT